MFVIPTSPALSGAEDPVSPAIKTEMFFIKELCVTLGTTADKKLIK